MVEMLPRVLFFLTDLACWPFEQIFRPLTSVKGWRIDEMLPRVLCFISQLTWILIWRNVAGVVNRFGLLTVRANFSTSYLSKWMENGWTAAQGALFLITTYLFWYPVVFLPLICFSKVLSQEMLLEQSTDLACWPFEQIFLPLTLVKGWRMVEPRVLCLLSQLTWILITRYISPSNLLF